jgi:purine-binding chemotaxis protein CheW
VWSRLHTNERLFENSLAETPERIDAAYRQRAIQLAKGETEEGAISVGLPVLVCRVAQERYAIELQDVVETLRFARCTPVPGGPPQFRGVMNLRGELRPVLDLGRLLDVSGVEETDAGFVVFLRRRERGIGLKVDRVEEVREIRQAELSVSNEGKYTKGMAAGALILLNAEAVLAEVFSEKEFVTT